MQCLCTWKFEENAALDNRERRECSAFVHGSLKKIQLCTTEKEENAVSLYMEIGRKCSVVQHSKKRMQRHTTE